MRRSCVGDGRLCRVQRQTGLALFQLIIAAARHDGRNQPRTFGADALDLHQLLGLGLQYLAEIAEVLNEPVRQRVCVCPRDGEKQQIFECLVFGQAVQSVSLDALLHAGAVLRVEIFVCHFFTSHLYVLLVLLYTVKRLLPTVFTDEFLKRTR